MNKDLHLKQFKANSFMGISSDSPVVIDFTTARKNQGVTLLRGDQGSGKSSTLNGIMRMMGAAFGFDLKNTVNLHDETIDVEQSFMYEGFEYVAKLSGDRLTLKRLYMETGRWIPEGTPVDTLKKIFGNLGISPMFLKEMEGKKQIEWFKKTFGGDIDVKKEARVEKMLVEAVDNRKGVNKTIVQISGWLAQNELFQQYEANQKKFKQPISAEKEKKCLEDITESNKEYERNVHGLQSLQNQLSFAQTDVQRLRKELAAAEEKEKELVNRVNGGKKWIEENKSIPVAFEKANKEWMSLSKTLAAQSQWKEVLSKEKELHDNEDAVIAVNALIDTLRRDLLELTSAYLPDIKGLEIRTRSTSIDNESEDEGLYYQGKSLAQLSESELAELFLLIWKAKDVCFVFIENISSYGSAFIKLLNDLVKKGEIKVLASEMDRKKKEMEITFETKID
jgi:hypothetical protein